jgi:uncharacterized protein YjbJ (UPF0337 family)
MNESFKGTIEDVAGKVQDAVGGATGDAGMQAEGKIRQAAGKAQRTYGDTVESIRNVVVDSPLAVMAVVAGVSFVLGTWWASRD